MGLVKGIDYERYPEQSIRKLGKKVMVCYGRDLTKIHTGIIVRDDQEEPYETIIKCDNGRYLRGTECQYRMMELRVEKFN